MKYQPDKMDEEAVVEIKRAHDKGKKRTVKKKVQRKRSKRPSEKRKKKGHANNNKTIAKKVNSSNVLKHKEITTYENVIAGSNLSPGTVVLVVGGTQIETGEYIRMCPFCCALEFAMIEAEIQYQIIRTDMFCGDNKPKWFKNVHPEAKPAVPCLYSDGKWIFDTINIINEFKRLQKDTSKDKILSYTEGYDKFSAMTVVKYAGSADNSEEESSTRAELMSLLQPYIDRLKTNKYLGGDSLSYSDCFFSQQMCSIGVIVKVLKGSDMMESIPELSSYLKRLKMRDSWKFVRGAWEIRHTEDDVRLVEYEFGKQFCTYGRNRWKLPMANYDRVVKGVNLRHSEITTYENVIAGSNLSPGTVVLVVGGTQIETGEYIRMCPFCCALEFAMIEAEIQYQIIRTDMFCGDNKPKWFKNVHPEAKPAVPCLYSDGKWIFDTINIINEFKRLQKDTSKDKILSYTEGYDKFSAMTVVKYAGSADNSEEESSTRAELMSLLQPYIDRLKTNKYLGGDSLSYSDCFFSQQILLKN